MDRKANICSIPPEIFNQIVEYLDEGPSTPSKIFGQPTLSIIAGNYSHPPLKSLSKTCRGFRRLLFHKVFKCTILLITAGDRDAERQSGEESYAEWPTPKFTAFVDFIQEKELSLVVKSFTLAIKAQPDFDEHEYYHHGRYTQSAVYKDRWRYLLQDAIPMLDEVMIIAPPTILGVLTSIPVKPQSIKALHIPYQVLALVRESVPHPKQRAEIQCDQMDEVISPGLFEVVKWDSMLLNEGSFLRSYANSMTWQGKMFMSEELIHTTMERKMFSHIKNFVYIGLWAPQKHLRHVVRFIASLPQIEDVRFSLQTTGMLLEDPRLCEPIDEGRLAAELQDSYPEMMYMFNQAGELADHLEIESCFDHLYYVECLDTKDMIDFDIEEDFGDQWSWMDDESNTHILVKDESWMIVD